MVVGTESSMAVGRVTEPVVGHGPNNDANDSKIKEQSRQLIENTSARLEPESTGSEPDRNIYENRGHANM